MDKLYHYIIKGATEGKIEKDDAVRMVTMLRQNQAQSEKNQNEDIAIIGMSSHIAGMDSSEEFWNSIESRLDSMGTFPPERSAGIDSYLANKLEGMDWSVKYLPGAYMNDIESFDYGFFRITPKEASLLDPSQRVFLQTVWEAIEDSGHGGQKLVGSNTGVYVGYASNSNYHTMILDTVPEMASTALIGNIAAMLPTRIAYFLNLKGPTMILDTACSSSSVAIHLSCNAIRNGDCDLAIAGGIRLNLLPLDNEGLKLGFEASDGRTKTFDVSAEGAGWGEGSAALVLKPLSKAKQDGDYIYAVIKGSAVNQDGASIGITAPNSNAQAEVLLKAWKDAGIDPETIAYIEAHGTATKLGDPIEIEGLIKAFRKHTDKKQFCAISTVKTNVGHLYECAGIAGVIKAVLSLQHRKIPASNHFSMPNKTIDFNQSPVYVNTHTREWKAAADHPRRCGVSAFGLSGTNCHIVLEEYIPESVQTEEPDDKYNVLTLSAQSMPSLKGVLLRYDQYLERENLISLRDLCYTANTGRGHYSYRISIMFKGYDDLKHKIALSANDLHEETFNRKDIRFGKHKVVSSNKQSLGEGEIKDGFRKELTLAASEKLKQYCQTEQKNAQLLHDICDLYVRGADIHWQELYQGEIRRSIPAPVYVFDKHCCWLDMPEQKKDIRKENSLFYKMEWRKHHSETEERLEDQGTILMLRLSGGVGHTVAEHLRIQNPVIEVELAEGTMFQKVDGNHYCIDGSLEGYIQLMVELRHEPISQIIHALTLDGQTHTETLDDLKEIQNRSGKSLFYLTKAMGKAKIQIPVELCIITRNSMQIHGKEKKLVPGHAPLYAMGKVITKEMDNLTCKFIDVDEVTSIQHIVRHIHSVKNRYALAFRDGECYSETFTECPIEQNAPVHFSLQEQGVYVITGGLGGIGLEVAKFFATQKRVNLALLNRSSIPPREEWHSILESGSSEKMKKKINALQELEAMGAVVDVISVDVSDYGETKRVIENLKEKYKVINGIVHGAGVSNDGPLAQRSEKFFEEIYSPKVYGTWNLDNLTRDQPMDFFIMFSSVATIFSASGQGDYAAANAFMDTYAAYREKSSGRTISINWTTWKETGMAFNGGHVFDTIFKTLSTEKAIKSFGQLLKRNVNRVLIGEIHFEGAGGDLLKSSGVACSEEILKKITAKKKRRIMAKFHTISKKEAKHADVVMVGRETGEYSELEEQLALCCKVIFGHEEIDIYDTFFKMGADSLMLMELQDEIESRLFFSVALSELFEYMSVFQLSEYMQEKSKDRRNEASSKYPELLNVSSSDQYFPAAYSQTSLYLGQKRNPQTTGYNQFRVSVLDIRIEPERMEYAVCRMIERHESLRTAISSIDGEIVQRILDHVDFKLDYRESDEAGALDIIRNFKQSFDLSAPPLFRLGLVKVTDDKCYLLYDAHHIITDGVSMKLFMSELVQLYKGETLAEPRYQYKDYVEWQRKCMQMDFMRIQEAYWVGEFKDEVPLLQLPTDYPRAAQLDFEGSMIMRYADRDLFGKLKEQALNTGSTLYIVLLVSYSILLSKYSAQEDLVIGSPVEGRPKRELDKVLGVFINMIGLRMMPAKELTYLHYLEQVKINTAQAFDHQDYPLNELINHLKIKRNANRHPLFDTVFIFQNQSDDDQLNGGHSYSEIYNLTDYDLTLEAIEIDGMLQFRLEYNTKLFHSQTAERMLRDYLSILGTIAKRMDIEIQDIELDSHLLMQPVYAEVDDISFNL